MKFDLIFKYYLFRERNQFINEYYTNPSIKCLLLTNMSTNPRKKYLSEVFSDKYNENVYDSIVVLYYTEGSFFFLKFFTKDQKLC